MSKNKIITRKDEIRYTTDDPKMMLNKFIASNIYKEWQEDFVDPETGYVQSITRKELLFDKGTYISQDVLAKIRFNISAGDITEVEVSNQNRQASVLQNQHLYLYKAQARIATKKVTFLLYATSVRNVLTILTDYIELNHKGGFVIYKVEEFDNCLVLLDTLGKPIDASNKLDVAYLKGEITFEEYNNATFGDNESIESDFHFYQIQARIIQTPENSEGDDEEITAMFIVQTYTAARANIIIEKYLKDKQDSDYNECLLKHPDRKFIRKEIKTFIEECKVIPIGRFIPLEFSQVYQYDDEKTLL